MFQSKVVNKPLDLVGRAVLTTDANLDLDQVSLPQDSVWKAYNPFIIRRLVQSGLPAVHAKEYVESKHPLAREHLLEELKDRPINLIRDPQIALHSSQGFFVKMNSDPKDTTLKFNPLIAKGMGADLDGDQLTYFIPTSDKAKEEVKNKMLPSKNLLFPRNFSPAFVPNNESSLGLYQSSTASNNNKVKHFKNQEEVLKAYEKGELQLGDKVLFS
jgi:DNA-directed RNA polymerase subunit beta'